LRIEARGVHRRAELRNIRADGGSQTEVRTSTSRSNHLRPSSFGRTSARSF
jgi:hypothetical protein